MDIWVVSPVGIVDKATLHIDVQISTWVPTFSSWRHTSSRTAESDGTSFLKIFSDIIQFSTVATTFYVPTSHAQRFLFLHILINSCYFLLEFLLFFTLHLIWSNSSHWSLLKISGSDEKKLWTDLVYYTMHKQLNKNNLPFTQFIRG